MAKEAKLPYEYDTERVLHLKELERFAAFVAAAEREACAKVCEALRDEDGYEAWNTECAAAIRATGEK
jgi:hypothetical protein